MNPLFSIIIPTYNRADLISETLDSVLAQTYTNWECIVVDDGSTDNTATVLAKYIEKDSRFQYHQRPIGRIKGPNSCRNYGFELSKGDLIKWFDSDDILLEKAIEKNVLVFNNHSMDLIVSSLEYVDFNLNKIDKKHNFISSNIIDDYLIGNITYFTFTPSWTRNFLKKQNDLFDESITYLDDWDFNLRMLYQKPAIKFIDEPLIQYRVHEASLSKEINKLNFKEVQSEFRAREKQLKLLMTNKLTNPRILQNYIKDRYKSILRQAFLQNDSNKKYYLKMLFISQLKTFDFVGFFKTIFGVVIFSVFNKGYKLLK
jgi:glycosyltransferase involved in cell wall biosynthesis